MENPCVTVKNLSTTQTSFIVYVEQSLSNSYSVVTNSSDDGTYKTTNFYIIPSSTTGLSATGIPNYSLAVTRDGVDVTTGALLYAGDTVVITATPAEGVRLQKAQHLHGLLMVKRLKVQKTPTKSLLVKTMLE